MKRLILSCLCIVVMGVALSPAMFAQEADATPDAPAVETPAPEPAAGTETKVMTIELETLPPTDTETDTEGDEEATTEPATRPAPKPVVAHMRLSGSIPDSPPEVSLFGDGGGGRRTLRDWLARLAQARDDARVQAVALELDRMALPWSQAQELADAIRQLDQVKPVHVFFTVGGIGTYTVAAAGRDVAMEPAGELDIRGLAGEMTYFRGTLDLLGIVPQMIQIGKFKGAAEPMTDKTPTPEFQAEMDKIFDDLYDQMVTQIAQARRLEPADVKAAMDEGPFTGRQAQAVKFVDTLVERGQWQEHVRNQEGGPEGAVAWRSDYGLKKTPTPDVSNPLALLSSMMQERGETIKSPTVAIVHADGMIVDGSSGSGLLGQKMVGARTMVRALNEVAADNRIKAIVLRIDSPGGSAIASELIFQAVRDASKKKPVVVSVSSMAASGGYYIAVGGPTIYADATSLVGSIGVVTGKLATTDTFEKIGMTTHAITRGKNAGLELSRPWTDAEAAVVTRHAQTTYDLFVRRVAEGRGEKIAQVDEIAQGRIFTARQALANGMIDHIGGLRDAIADARKQAGLETSNLISLPRPKTFADMFFNADGDESHVPAPLRNLTADSRLLQELARHRGAVYLLNLASGMRNQTMFTALPYHVQLP